MSATSSDPSTPVKERRRSMEEMSKEELIAMFHKVRAQTLQIATDKKQTQETLDSCMREKDELRNKALVIIQRCKELEEKQTLFNEYKTRCESYATLLADQGKKIEQLEGGNEKQKGAEIDREHQKNSSSSAVPSEENSALQTLIKYLESELLKKEESSRNERRTAPNLLECKLCFSFCSHDGCCTALSCCTQQCRVQCS